MTIDSFRGNHAFLSNFYESPVKIGSISYPTAEHAFQAAKTNSKVEKINISEAKTPAEAKHLGRKVKLREDWENIKIQVMEFILIEKFNQNPVLKRKLLDTGENMLVENNTWNDTYWGMCNGKGKNVLGSLLMKIRKNIQEGRFQ